MTALSIAQRLGYISVVEELKVVTETTISSKHELITEERYKVINQMTIFFFIFI
jgi:ankyrin